MRKRSATTVPGAKPRPSAAVEMWPTLGEGDLSRRASEAIAVGNREGELAGVPHDEQKRAASGTSAAQLGQRNIVADCIAGPEIQLRGLLTQGLWERSLPLLSSAELL